MTISNKDLLHYLNNLLEADRIQDYCPNGLQVEGKPQISKIVTGVTASMALIEKAIASNADAILVHHGYFWKGETENIVGMKKQRIAALLQHDINLFAYHLPLDIHPIVGNNVRLAKLLGINSPSVLDESGRVKVVMKGSLDTPVSAKDFAKLLEKKLQRVPLFEGDKDKLIKSIAWCTGGGQGYIDLAAEQGVDAYLTGEVSEQTIHVARERGIQFFAAGHHATERYGVKALGEHLALNLKLEHEFIDIDNPA